MSNKLINIIFKLNFPYRERIFICLRYLSNPFDEIIEIAEHSSNILDIGCGHGLLEFLLEKKDFKGKVTGIDPDKNKIVFAKKLFRNKENFLFKSCSLEQLSTEQKFDCVTLIDVDYLLNKDAKIKILKNISNLLKKSGQLIIKTVVKTKSLGFYLGYIQEIITVLLFRKTFSKEKNFYFMNKFEYENLLTKSGFQIMVSKNISKPLHYHPHHLFVVKKKYN